MLEIIYGKAGTGKSALLYKKLSEEAEKGKKVFLFVPDQFSFEAEKNVYRSVRAPYGINVTVTMFSKAAQKMLQSYGMSKPYADDVVKTVLMKRTLNGLFSEGRLLYYSRQLRNRTFPDIMLGIISELRSGGLTPSELRSVISLTDDFSDILNRKLNDICEIYSEYDALLTASFSDRLDDVRRAAQLVATDGFYKDAVCFFDCFDEFSGSQLAFIKALAMRSEKTVFALTTDSINSEKQEFRAMTRLIGKLKLMNEGEAEFIHMEEQFRRCKDYSVIKARDMWQECDWICAEIRLLMDEGYRCRDIAVLMPDRSYGQILQSAMHKYDIPAFIDVPEPLINKGIIRFIIHTLQALSFETEDILRYIKSGYVRKADGKTVRDMDIDALEQLCRRYDLRKRDWLKPFHIKADPDGNLEELRKAITEPLLKLKKRIENADGAEITEALCGFLRNDIDIERSIYNIYLEKRDENGKVIVKKQKQDEYTAIWDKAVEIFESAYEALQGLSISINEYTEILSDIFSSSEIAKPPQVLDAVTVGDVERSRFNKLRAVFICGVNNGVFPRPASSGTAFTGSETEDLAAHGITIGNDRISRVSSERFKLYRCINLPEERLFITYSVLSDKLSELLPSPYIEELKTEYKIQPIGADDFGAEFYCRTEKSARRYLASIYSLKGKSGEKKAVTEALGENMFRNLLENAMKGISERHRISPENAMRLMDKPQYSPSAIEKINNCKYAYFCRYGLGIKAEDKRETGAILSGNVVHYCLERLLAEYMGKRAELIKLCENELEHKLEGYIGDYLSDNLLDGFGSSYRFTYQVKRLMEIALPAAVNVQNGIKFGGFTPFSTEHELSFRFGDITVKGNCDRFDVSETDSGKYVRIIDYKRGKNQIPLEDIYQGANLQTLLYLFGLCEELNAKPSSVMYQPVGAYERAPVKNNPDEDAKKNAIDNADSHKANGIIFGNSPEIEEIQAINEYYSELYGEKKNGYSVPHILSDKSFSSMKEYCKAYVNATVMETKSGMAGACPKNERLCEYCDYKLFCGHEIKKGGDDNGE